MRDTSYTVASSAQLVGAANVGELDEVKTMDHASKESNHLKRSSALRRSVRFPPSNLRTQNLEQNGDDEATGTDIFTHSRHASWSSDSPTTAIPESLPLASEEPQAETLELLKPICYSPQTENRERESESLRSYSSGESLISVKERVKDYEAQVTPPLESHARSASKGKELQVDVEASNHIRSPSSSSNSSARRRGRKSQGLEIYFTPTVVTESKIFLSSPQDSPTLPNAPNIRQEPKVDEEEDATTPKATATTTTTRPSSEIYVGPVGFETSFVQPRKEKLKIMPSQMDQLVTALSKSRMIQKDVRKHWWDIDDIPDDETIDSFTSVSLPTLTSASTLYSHPNENFVGEHRSSKLGREILEDEFAKNFPNHPNAKRSTAPVDAPFGGVALTDPKIHGSPIRFVTKDYRIGASVFNVGACSHVQVPYGVDVECNLRIQQRTNYNKTCRIMLQCVNQVVDRKTGKKNYLLLAEEDVTEAFTKAALAEFSLATGKDVADIDLIPSPTAPSPLISPEIDWVAVADELQATSETSALIESTLTHFANLSPETCAMQTHTLLSLLERIKDQHQDFLILRPTAYHDNGVPSNMRLPWVSQRLYNDWYQTEESLGHSPAAKAFQAEIVAAVAKHALAGETFTAHVGWEDERLVVQCVPLSESSAGRCDAWACFVRGMFDV